MPQDDYLIANATGALVRTDVNNQLQAIVTQNSGGTPPSPAFPNMVWADTNENVLKRRNNANTAWLSLAPLNESNLKVTAAVTTATTITAANSGTFYLVDASASAVTMTLPSAASVSAGFTVTFKKTDANNDVIIATNGSQTIDGAASHTLTVQYQVVTLCTDGNNWFLATSTDGIRAIRNFRSAIEYLEVPSGTAAGNGTQHSGTWTVPANVFQVQVELFGAGGGGAGDEGGAGGGGAYVRSLETVTPGASIAYQIGIRGGGLADNDLGSAQNGGGSTWGPSGSTRPEAGGGFGASGAPGAGGIAENGDYRVNGGGGDDIVTIRGAAFGGDAGGPGGVGGSFAANTSTSPGGGGRADDTRGEDGENGGIVLTYDILT